MLSWVRMDLSWEGLYWEKGWFSKYLTLKLAWVWTNLNGCSDKSEWILWPIRMGTVTNQNRLDAVTSHNEHCDQSEWMLWPIRMDIMTNEKCCYDQSEWTLWLIRMDIIRMASVTNQKRNCGQWEWTPVTTAAMAVAVCSAEYEPWLGAT